MSSKNSTSKSPNKPKSRNLSTSTTPPRTKPRPTTNNITTIQSRKNSSIPPISSPPFTPQQKPSIHKQSQFDFIPPSAPNLQSSSTFQQQSFKTKPTTSSPKHTPLVPPPQPQLNFDPTIDKSSFLHTPPLGASQLQQPIPPLNLRPQYQQQQQQQPNNYQSQSASFIPQYQPQQLSSSSSQQFSKPIPAATINNNNNGPNYQRVSHIPHPEPLFTPTLNQLFTTPTFSQQNTTTARPPPARSNAPPRSAYSLDPRQATMEFERRVQASSTSSTSSSQKSKSKSSSSTTTKTNPFGPTSQFSKRSFSTSQHSKKFNNNNNLRQQQQQQRRQFSTLPLSSQRYNIVHNKMTPSIRKNIQSLCTTYYQQNNITPPFTPSNTKLITYQSKRHFWHAIDHQLRSLYAGTKNKARLNSHPARALYEHDMFRIKTLLRPRDADRDHIRLHQPSSPLRDAPIYYLHDPRPELQTLHLSQNPELFTIPMSKMECNLDEIKSYELSTNQYKGWDPELLKNINADGTYKQNVDKTALNLLLENQTIDQTLDVQFIPSSKQLKSKHLPLQHKQYLEKHLHSTQQYNQKGTTYSNLVHTQYKKQ